MPIERAKALIRIRIPLFTREMVTFQENQACVYVCIHVQGMFFHEDITFFTFCDFLK